MTLWIIVIAIGLATFLMRVSFIILFGHLKMPDWLRRALRFVPAAVLGALIVPDLLYREGLFMPANPRVIAGVIAGFVSGTLRTRNAIYTIGVGMIVLWITQALWSG